VRLGVAEVPDAAVVMLVHDACPLPRNLWSNALAALAEG
jgi:hypothetical protein